MKKILFISYYFPPLGGGGVQRSLKFIKYLPQYGWDPIIISSKGLISNTIDNSLINEIPKNSKVNCAILFIIYSPESVSKNSL